MISKEFKVGMMALVCGTILYIGFNFLKGDGFFSESKKYYAIYDNIDGLKVSNDVIVNGYAVGRVSRIDILQDRGNQILVELDVNNNVVLGDSTKALLFNVDFLGVKGIQLAIKTVNTVLNDGDTLDSALEDRFGQIISSGERQIDNLGITITRINNFLLGLEGSGEEIKESIIALKGTLNKINAAIDQNENKVSETLESIKDLSGNLGETGDQVKAFLKNANATLDKVNRLELEETLDRFQELAATLNQSLVNFNDSDGTLNKLMTDETLYYSMNKTLLDLDSLLNHMNQYPKDFFAPLGRKHKKIIDK